MLGHLVVVGVFDFRLHFFVSAFYCATYFFAHFGGALANVFAGFFYVLGSIAGGLAYFAALIGSFNLYIFSFAAYGISTLGYARF